MTTTIQAEVAHLRASRQSAQAEADRLADKVLGLQFELGRAETRIAKLEAALDAAGALPALAPDAARRMLAR